MNQKYTTKYAKIGENIAYYRELVGFTQQEMADVVGITQCHIARIETAQSGMSLDILFAIAAALGYPSINFWSLKTNKALPYIVRQGLGLSKNSIQFQ